MKPPQYSTIRAEPVYKPADGFSLSAFYDTLLKPHNILLTIIVFVAAINRDLRPLLVKAGAGDSEAILRCLLVLMSVIAGWRLYQSLYLAKRDYSHITSGFGDIAIFLLITLFTAGALWAVFSVGLLMTLLIYAFCA